MKMENLQSSPYALRGLRHVVFMRDDFVCAYCGWDGKIWPNYLYLCLDHLLVRGHPLYDGSHYTVTACRFCNDLYNQTSFEGETPDELIADKKTKILARRQEYHAFWANNVQVKV